jgi:hypothetical protein
MKKKFTLVIDDEVIERAKRHARSLNTSVSDLVEAYLVEQTHHETWTPPTGTILSRITGAVRPDAQDQSDDDRREQALREKYA